MLETVRNSLNEARDALDALLRDQPTLEKITIAGSLLVTSFDRGGKAFSCGNGGSMCDAMHFAEELTGRFRGDRPAIAALAISDASHITCVANDYGYEQVFSRYLEAHGRSGDVLIALSTSGSSPNILRAAEVARNSGIAVVALTGRRDSPLEAIADVTICTPGGKFADRVQELHIKVLHILIELVEQNLRLKAPRP
ncbi:SIS domain-containing protein [Pseudomonas oryzihabitans]|uniref:SIS domain-containing protein n=1 Tax=Pseudomonas oryzihabitans TaxID=47885 RepID=UPI0015E283C4|nr:SIS domain-containing protein [Pseudomonas psychrotolerans]MBA1258726.1 SIS domain-containing protein [Pseudomonas psychrotolerans]